MLNGVILQGRDVQFSRQAVVQCDGGFNLARQSKMLSLKGFGGRQPCTTEEHA